MHGGAEGDIHCPFCRVRSFVRKVNNFFDRTDRHFSETKELIRMGNQDVINQVTVRVQDLGNTIGDRVAAEVQQLKDQYPDLDFSGLDAALDEVGTKVQGISAIVPDAPTEPTEPTEPPVEEPTEPTDGETPENANGL